MLLHMKESFDLIVVTTEYFPDGGAATNRIISYAKEIAKKKKVLLLSLAAQQFNKCEIRTSGNFQGISYRYVQNPNGGKHNPGKIIRSIRRIPKPFLLYWFMLFKYSAPTCIYISRNMRYALRMKAVSLIKGMKLIREISEAPYYITNTFKRNIVKQMYRMFDGMIAMTTYIRDFFDGVVSQERFFILPMSVDASRFKTEDNTDGKQIFYCSGGNLERDGLKDILDGFLLFQKTHPTYKLRIATPFDEKDDYHKNVLKIIRGNENCVDYLGVLAAAEIPSYISSSTCFILTPHTDYVTKGFPTKLGEYMVSGKPVICSKIQSLTENIDDGCVIWVNTNSPSDICDALCNIVSDPAIASEIGERGRKMVLNKYTIPPHLDALMKFLQI